MKFLDEYRDAPTVERLLERLRATATRPWTLMEVCGGQTHSLVKNGIIAMLPANVRMVHGPGCPVCVTPIGLIDHAVDLALNKGVTVFSFGDMLRVPGSVMSLSQAKAQGANVRIVYSPLEAVKWASEHPDVPCVFFAVGFETTAPANALAVLQAAQLGVKNFSLLASQVLVPPAIAAIMDDPDSHIQGFLAAGHVCTVMGIQEYQPLVEKYHIPITVTGFEPVDLLHGILMTVTQLERGEARVENQYARVVQTHGNAAAQQAMQRVFRVVDREWRGIGTIPKSGLDVREEYADFDAHVRYGLGCALVDMASPCIAGQVLKGQKKPYECAEFGKACTPLTPLGAPMVSSEGACAAYYHVHHEGVTA